MPTDIKVDTSALERKIAQFAIVSGKGLFEALETGARRFVVTAVKNTMPMTLSKSPAQAKREWQEKRRVDLESHRVTKEGYRKYSEVRRMLAEKNRKLGREAAGWNKAAEALKAKVPSWVARHGTSEGGFSRVVRGGRIAITMTNSVPYNDDMTRRRAEYALRSVAKGFDGNLRAMKKKLIRTLK